jgi:hypothetical protein
MNVFVKSGKQVLIPNHVGLCAVVTAVITLHACAKHEIDLPQEDVGILQIHTDRDGQRSAGLSVTRALVSAFQKGDTLGLYVTDATTNAPYNDMETYRNLASEWDGKNWTQSVPVFLDNRPAKVYAYYPYRSTVENWMAMPIEAVSQTDYMCAYTYDYPNIAAPDCKLMMRHVLSQIVLRIKTVNYNGKGILQEVRIENSGTNTNFFSSGTLDLTTGNITGTGTAPLILSANHVLSDTESAFSLLTFPAWLSGTKPFLLTLRIDDVNYTHPIGNNNAWMAGYRNIYSVTLEGKQLALDGNGTDNVSIIPWTDFDRGVITLTPQP